MDAHSVSPLMTIVTGGVGSGSGSSSVGSTVSQSCLPSSSTASTGPTLRKSPQRGEPQRGDDAHLVDLRSRGVPNRTCEAKVGERRAQGLALRRVSSLESARPSGHASHGVTHHDAYATRARERSAAHLVDARDERAPASHSERSKASETVTTRAREPA